MDEICKLSSNQVDPDLEEILGNIQVLLQQNLTLEDFRNLYSAQMHLSRRSTIHLPTAKNLLKKASKREGNLSPHFLFVLSLLEAYELNLAAAIESLRKSKALAETYRDVKLLDRVNQLLKIILERKSIFDLYSAALDSTRGTQLRDSIKLLALREAREYLLTAQTIIGRSNDFRNENG